MATFHVQAESTTATGLSVTARDFEWLVDEPASLGGENSGPNPVEYVLGALLGCLNVMVHIVAEERGVTVSSFSATARGDLDPAKFLGRDTDQRAGYKAIEVDIEVEADADAATLEQIVEEAESRCPVSDNLAHETPLRIRIGGNA